ncbi:TIGR02569 family protein [Gordonia sp. HY002]|uniref:TIGR02569 family protein n=1 Tax=Gordonia zhenghanii TaxID=2911516 RepID=UPI001EF1027A|nr:TIGR02569 family protein [Gordonia zhenghanii]MCF8571182.1 TIGR02569 family protein [Gordonia zhenghanii]MCF8606200.1 TIGR02569 family protein [Gordonia zhenghanii]MCF8606320.1 TIGR02569 family protein [Gordonia zhenghanii]
MTTIVEPPEQVLTTFGLTAHPPIAMDGVGWRVGEVVLSLVPDHARAAWSATARENLYVEGMRIARPIRASDGRYVVSGWRADTYVAGSPEPRHDEVLAVADRLHLATAKFERPRFLLQPPAPPFNDVDVFTAADRAAWEEVPLRSARGAGMAEPSSEDGQHSLAEVKALAGLRRPVDLTSQLVHGDLFGTVLFAGAAAPAITDLVPYWRPAPWASAVIVVDALAWGGAEEELVERWSDTPEWSQMMLRATMFRLAVHALHPRSTAGALPGLLRVVEIVRMMV